MRSPTKTFTFFLKKGSFLSLILIPSIVAFALLKIVLRHDISMESVATHAHPANYSTLKPAGQPGVYLISYADGNEVFFRNQNALSVSAMNKGIDFILNYRKYHLAEDFIKKNQYIFDQKTGAGLWLWKPYLILKTLESVPPNAIVIYLDAGFSIQKSVTPILEKLQTYDMVLARYNPRIYGDVGKIASRALLKAMDCDREDCRKGPHLPAGIGAFKNTEHSRQFVKRWLEYCQDAELLMGTHYAKYPNYPEFSHHHDESILSVLYSKQPQKISLMSEDKELSDIFIWHHRHPNRAHVSLLSYMGKRMGSIERDILDSWFIQKVRTWLKAYDCQKEQKAKDRRLKKAKENL